MNKYNINLYVGSYQTENKGCVVSRFTIEDNFGRLWDWDLNDLQDAILGSVYEIDSPTTHKLTLIGLLQGLRGIQQWTFEPNSIGNVCCHFSQKNTTDIFKTICKYGYQAIQHPIPEERRAYIQHSFETHWRKSLTAKEELVDITCEWIDLYAQFARFFITGQLHTRTTAHSPYENQMMQLCNTEAYQQVKGLEKE